MAKTLPVSALIANIRKEHAAALTCARDSVLHVIRCGQFLHALKTSCAPGEFEQHLKQIEMSRTTAWRYVRVASDAVKNKGRVNYLLEQGASLVDLYRAFDLVKPVEQGSYKADVYQRRKLGEQLELDFSYEECLGHLKALVKAPNVEELSESSLKKLDAELAAARERVQEQLADKRAVDLDSEAAPLLPKQGRSSPQTATKSNP